MGEEGGLSFQTTTMRYECVSLGLSDISLWVYMHIGFLSVLSCCFVTLCVCIEVFCVCNSMYRRIICVQRGQLTRLGVEGVCALEKQSIIIIIIIIIIYLFLRQFHILIIIIIIIALLKCHTPVIRG